MKPASARPGASARNKAAEEEASLKLIEQMLAYVHLPLFPFSSAQVPLFL